MTHFKKYFIYSCTLFFITACGGGGGGSSTNSSTTTTTTATAELIPSSLKVSVNNTGEKIQKRFNDYTIQVLSDKTLSTNTETSHETVAIYGTINGKSTKALLKINDNYRNSNITIEVYKNETLVAKKENLSLTNQVALNFGNIIINE